MAIYYLKMNDRVLAEVNLTNVKELDWALIIKDYDEELEKLSQTVSL